MDYLIMYKGEHVIKIGGNNVTDRSRRSIPGNVPAHRYEGAVQTERPFPRFRGRR